MILIESTDILINHGQGLIKRGEGSAIDRMRVGSSNDVRSSCMNRRMYGERRSIHWMIAFDHIPVVIDSDETRDVDLTEVHAIGVDPKRIGKLWVTCRDMPGDTFIESKSGKKSKYARQTLLSMQPLLLDRFKNRWLG